MTTILKEDIEDLKNKLESFEDAIDGQMKNLEVREEKWARLESVVREVMSSQGQILKLNVGGKKFQILRDTILKYKDTLLAKIILSNKFNLNDELFFDRSPKMFPFILEYYRTGKVNYKNLTKEEKNLVQIEADYYEMEDIFASLGTLTKDIEFVSFEHSGPYIYNKRTAGSNNIEDLKDKSLQKGICTNSPGWIVIELNHEWEFNEIQIGGYNGNSELWYNANGAGANILTSNDKISWTTVGTIPSYFGNAIQTVKLTKSSSARYIKFTHNSYLGIGYLHIKKLE